MVPKAESCPQLGSILYETSNNPEIAMLITNVLDKLPRSNQCNEAMSRIANNDQLISENFKFCLRNDKYFIRDYYVLVCLVLTPTHKPKRNSQQPRLIAPKTFLL